MAVFNDMSIKLYINLTIQSHIILIPIQLYLVKG